MLTLLKLRRLYVAKGATFELTKRLGVQRICLLWLRSNRLLLDFDRDIDLVLVILARLALHPKVVLLLLRGNSMAIFVNQVAMISFKLSSGHQRLYN